LKKVKVEKYIVSPIETRLIGKKEINIFACDDDNVDQETIKSFGDEWKSFSKFSDHDIKVTGEQYFDIVPESIYAGKYVLDVGCGTGRWSKYISQLTG
jgi:hypothetical protein